LTAGKMNFPGKKSLTFFFSRAFTVRPELACPEFAEEAKGLPDFLRDHHD